eukprot:6491630-Amphidinium_carterae.1
MEEEEDQRPGEPDEAGKSEARGSGEPAPRHTPAQLFVSKKPRTLAVRAMLEAKGPAPKAESSDEGFHDPRDDVEEPGEPANGEAAQEHQPSIQAELMQRAAEAVAEARASPERRPEDDVDFGVEEDDL